MTCGNIGQKTVREHHRVRRPGTFDGRQVA
jgi:hypothetical protein